MQFLLEVFFATEVFLSCRDEFGGRLQANLSCRTGTQGMLRTIPPERITIMISTRLTCLAHVHAQPDLPRRFTLLIQAGVCRVQREDGERLSPFTSGFDTPEESDQLV